MNGEVGDELLVSRHMVKSCTVSLWVNADMVVDPNALALPAHTPVATIKGFTLSLAKQVVSGNMDDVIETAKDNVRLL